MPQELGDSAFADAGIPMAFVAPSQERGGLGRILAANGAMAFFTGRTKEDLSGLSFADLVHRDDVALFEDLIARLCRGDMETCSFEKRFEHADGHRTWGLVTVAQGHELTGNRQGALVVQVHDISERKHFVGQLEYFADHDPLTGLPNRSLLNQRLRQIFFQILDILQPHAEPQHAFAYAHFEAAGHGNALMRCGRRMRQN